ncbi:MAG: hypothetical protein JWP35_44 [Caulobacter sp.]|nr:hypothetical protein [Caulobacter sp.]
MSEFQGKTILITGAARGIGKEAAREFALAGATVIAADIDESALAETAREVGVDPLVLDVTSPELWAKAQDHVRARHGKLDALVNNAGVILNRPFLMTTLEDLRRVNSINVESVWIGMQTFFPLLAETAKTTNGAAIINVSSIYGLVAGPIHAAYCASKGAVHLLTKAVAVEFGRMGSKVRVNSLHPGPVNTDLGRSGFQDAVNLGAAKTVEDARAMTDAMHPLGRMAEVEDIVGGILFLASDRSRFMTGTEVVIDGGYIAR